MDIKSYLVTVVVFLHWEMSNCGNRWLGVEGKVRGEALEVVNHGRRASLIYGFHEKRRRRTSCVIVYCRKLY